VANLGSLDSARRSISLGDRQSHRLWPVPLNGIVPFVCIYEPDAEPSAEDRLAEDRRGGRVGSLLLVLVAGLM